MATAEQKAKKAEANKLYRLNRAKQGKEEAAKRAENVRRQLSQFFHRDPAKPLDISPVERENREAWLARAVDMLDPQFEARGYPLPEKIRVALGWPKSKKAIGICFDREASSGGYTEIFISPVLAKPLEILSVLVHELCHAAIGCEHGHKKPFIECATALDLIGKPTQANGLQNPDWLSWAEPLCEELGPVPHDAMIGPQQQEKKQTTRMIKCECDACGLVMRTTNKWIDYVVKGGARLRCPCDACHGIPVPI